MTDWRGILDTTFIPRDLRTWSKWLGPINRRYRLLTENGRGEVRNSRAEDLRFHRTLSAGNVSSTQSVSPLTAVDAGSDVTITIASHELKLGDGDLVAYSGGTIVGQPYDTKLYVYANDTEFEGGAVSYAASDDPLDTIDLDRYLVGIILTPEMGGAGTGGIGGGGSGGRGGYL